MNSKSGRVLVSLSIATTDGEFVASYTDKGLAVLTFPNTASKSSFSSTVATKQILQWHKLTSAALKRALAGQLAGELPPLDDSGGTGFQRSVWHAMRKIPSGQAQSYGEIAQAIGKPKAVRAVGGACGANPIPVLVPCHRVLAANKKIGGFSGGLDWKQKLLAREGVNLF